MSEPNAAEVKERAAEWLQRREFWNWSEADQAELDAWLAQSSAHEIAFIRMQAAWDRTQRLGALRKPMREPQRAARMRPILLRVAAACLALAIGVVRHEQTPPTLADLVVRHIQGPERDALQRTAPVPAAAIEHAFADRGVRLASVPGGVSYVHECPVGSWRTVHMVMPENGAPVSVLYVADHRVADGLDFHRGDVQGREIPIANGTLVLAARNADRFGAIEHTWRDAIEGPAQVAAGSR